MRIIDFLKLHPIVILIDSGNTHNFVDTKLVATLGLHPMGHDEIKVQIANGQEIVSPGRSKEVEVKMKGYAFQTNLFILPLAGCYAVLGIHWLWTLGPILWDFTKLQMEFTYNGVTCLLQGLQTGPTLHLAGDEGFKLPKHERKGFFLHLQGYPAQCLAFSGHAHPKPSQHVVPPPLAETLKLCDNVFQEPIGLPP
jgi:hypothetical protein